MSSLSPRLARFGLAALLSLGAVAGGVEVVAGAAWAQSPTVFEGRGVLELLRPTDLIGDGGTPTDLYVLALDPAGAPVVGWKQALTTESGTVTPLRELGGGLHVFTFTPSRTEGPTTATFELRGKMGPKMQPFAVTWSVPVAPSRAHPTTAAASPAALTLGTDRTANVTFGFSGGEPSVLAQIPVVHAVSVGTLTNLTNLGAGQYGGLYTAPTVNVPQVALVTAVDGGDPTRGYAAVALPLAAKIDQAVQVKPGASVLLKVGGRDFGPVTADAKGRAKVPVVVPAGTLTATRVVVVDGNPVEEPFVLSVPETRRLALFPTYAALPADARFQVPIRVFVVTPDGRPDEGAQLVLSASAGTIGAARHEGGGIYAALYTPPAGNAATTVTIEAKLAGAAAVQTDKRTVPLVPTRATSLALTSEPPVLPAGAASLGILAKVGGPDGAPLAGRTLAFAANGAKLAGVTDLKNGTYRAQFTPTGKGPVEVSASVAAPSASNALARVLVLASQDRLAPDGLSSVQLTLATVDDFGSPVPNVPVELRLLSGDGSVPATATTDASGVARVYYTAGRTNAVVHIDAVARDRSAGVTLMQVPPALTLPDLPVSATPATRALAAEFVAASATLRVERQ